jgi:predicted ATPase
MLLKSLSELAHKSQVILTSRETPKEVNKKLQNFQRYSIEGLGYQASVELLKSQGLQGSKREIKGIAKRYGGHPQALILAAALIREDFNGSTECFMNVLPSIKDVDGLIEEQFNRLGKPEQRFLCRISVFRKAVPFKALKIINQEAIEETNNLVRSLRNRSLLNYQFLNEVRTYNLHSIIQDYAYNKLEDKQTGHQLAYNYYDSVELKPRK